MTRQIAALSLGWLLSVPVYAQSDLPPVSLAQLTRPAGWQLVGSVSPNAESTSMKTTSGANVLVGSSAPLTLLTPTADFRVRFETLMTAGADVVLTLPNGQSISLAHSQEIARILKAPGLWQTVELWYKIGTTKSSSMLEKLAINGVTVREGQTVAGTALGPLTIMAKTGSVALRNVGYRVMTPRIVAQWAGPLSYTIVEGGYIQSPEEAVKKKVLKQDTTALLNYEVSYGQPRQYTIFFTGKLNALQTGDYRFDLNQGGLAALWIDGKEVLPINHLELGMPNANTIPLTAGPHDIKVYFSRSWFRPGLGLYVSQAGTRPQPLHAPTSLPEPDPVAVVSVNPDFSDAGNQVQRIRSFVQLPGEKTKRTHSLSVGSPVGIHYTVDLNQMALLQVWKGDFANTTEMWYERGEPQLLAPLGPPVYLPAQTPLMVLTNDAAAWPDSVGENILQYKGLSINKQGVPMLTYTLAGATVTDATRAEGNALVRTLTLAGSPTGAPYCRVASGSVIEEVSKGLYAVNDRSYYIQIDPKAKVKMRQSNGKQELLLPVDLKNGTGSVHYSIVF
ncbi:PA14 domain-containing protein [Spirosoma litoris]